MHVESTAPETRVTGHLQVKGQPRKYYAHWIGQDGVKHTRTLGHAHVKASSRRTPRGAIVWRAADGPCPAGHLTPKRADDALQAILEDARRQPPTARPTQPPAERVSPTFGQAIDRWLNYLQVEQRRKRSTIQDARNTARCHLTPRFGADTPLRQPDGTDTLTTSDINAYRRELLASELSPRTVQKILVLLHGVFKRAKRDGLITTNPSEDAERVSLIDDGTFNILEPVEFEAVHRAALGEHDKRPENERDPDAIDALTTNERNMFAAMLATGYYAGLRLGELRDLPWRNVDFAGSMLRVESGYTHAERSTPKGNRARSAPLVPVLAQRLAQLSTRPNFTGETDYVFATEHGERAGDKRLREVFYAALTRAELGHKRDQHDQHGNPQQPIRVHDLRHSFCTWAVNVWPITKVKEFAGHRDIATTMKYVHHQTKADDAALGGAYLDQVLTPVA